MDGVASGPQARRRGASREVVHTGTASGERAHNEACGLRSSQTSAEPAVAVFVFLAGSAWARVVATDFLASTHERRWRRDRNCRVPVASAGNRQRLVVTGVLIFDIRDGRRFLNDLDILLSADLNGEHDLDDVLLDAIEHVGKKFERFALVFLLGILLRIAAQMDTLTQMIERG